MSRSRQLGPHTRQQRVALPSQRPAALQHELAAADVGPASLSPVYVLSDDLWSDILELAYAHDFPECHTAQFVPEQFPVPISRVSRYFRHIALNLPRLWTCIHITPLQPHRPGDQVFLVREQLNRSKDLPLTILFACHHDAAASTNNPLSRKNLPASRESHEHRYFVACWDLVVPHAQRWRRVSFYATYGQLVSELLRRDVFDQKLYMPVLEHLDVYSVQPPFRRVNQDAETGFHLDVSALDVPRLRCLRGSGNHWRISQHPSGLPLTELVLSEVTHGIPSDHFAEVLGSVGTTLTTLVVFDVIILGVVPFVQLPRLRHLVLEEMNSEHFSGDRCDPTHPVPAIRAFLDGSPQLKRLEFSGVPSDLPRFFSHRLYPSVQTLELYVLDELDCDLITPFPGLRHLTIYNNDCDPLIQGLLARSKSYSAQNPWPQLEKLSLGRSDSPADVAAHMIEFIKHRAEIGCPLKAFDLVYSLGQLLSPDVLHTFSCWLDFTLSPARDEERINRLVRWDWWADAPSIPYWIRDNDLSGFRT